MNENEVVALLGSEFSDVDSEALDFEVLERQLEEDLKEQQLELESLKDDFKRIGTPESLGETVMNVVWEQFVNQVGVIAGEDFIKENKGLTLDLRDSAHIQTAENFEKGKIATHNYISGREIIARYDRSRTVPHSEFRRAYVNPGMNGSLKRAGDLYNEGTETVKDLYTGRQIPTRTKLENGENNPDAAQREHVIASAELYKDPSLQMANGNEELAGVINSPDNLQGYTTARRNVRKSDHSPDEMEDRDKTKHWERAHERADRYIKAKKKEGETRLKKEGRKTQKEEALRAGGKVLRAILMGLLASLIKDVIRKLIEWFRSGKRKFSTFIESIKAALRSFFADIKEHLKKTAGDTGLTTILTAVLGPIVGMLKKAWMFLKQGYRSVKQVIQFLKDPKNKSMPLSIKMMEVGKIVVVGLTAGGSILLSEAIEKGLMKFPLFATPIPMLGSLGSILGMFLGGLVSGIIGALVLNRIDRMIANKQKQLNLAHQGDKRSEILATSDKLVVASCGSTQQKKTAAALALGQRHQEAGDRMKRASREVSDSLKVVQETAEQNELILQNVDDLLSQI
jgi:hypothetical protein